MSFQHLLFLPPCRMQHHCSQAVHYFSPRIYMHVSWDLGDITFIIAVINLRPSATFSFGFEKILEKLTMKMIFRNF